MRIPFVEEMVKTGSVRPEVRDAIYKDCETIITLEKLGDELPAQGFVNGITALGTRLAINHAVSLGKAQLDVKKMIEVRNKIASNPKFSSNAKKALDLFDEIATIAPSTTLNEPLMTSLIEKSLNTGMDHDTVLRLATLQAAILSSPTYQKKRVDGFQNAMLKQASCEKIGKLYADVYLLTKEAAKKVSVPTAVKLWDAIKTTAAVSSIPLMVGAGNAFIHNHLERKSKKELEQRLEDSYNTAFSYSKDDVIHEHPDKARRAFESLVHFAPHVAIDPYATRIFMNQIVPHEEGMNTSKVKELSDIERNLTAASGQGSMSTEFFRGADAAGFRDIFKGSITSAMSPTQKDMGDLIKTIREDRLKREY